jgi:hypothetical protein
MAKLQNQFTFRGFECHWKLHRDLIEMYLVIDQSLTVIAGAEHHQYFLTA